MFLRKLSIAVLPVMLGLAPLAGSAMAQDSSASGVPPAPHNAHRLQDKFATANVTHDGHLTLAQAKTGDMPMVARNFTKIDADHKGYATWADIRQFIQTRRAARQAQPADSQPTQ